MQLNIEVISDPLFQNDRANEVRVIGEILPFVLAKYSLDLQPTPRTEASHLTEDFSSRFQGV